MSDKQFNILGSIIATIIGLGFTIFGIKYLISLISYNPRVLTETFVEGKPNEYLIAGFGVILIASPFALSGIIQLIKMIKEERQKNSLLQEGRIIEAIVENVEFNEFNEVDGKYPYIVHCVYYDKYMNPHKFESIKLWADPYPYIQQGDKIRVFVMSEDYENYYVDVDHSIKGRIDYTL